MALQGQGYCDLTNGNKGLTSQGDFELTNGNTDPKRLRWLWPNLLQHWPYKVKVTVTLIMTTKALQGKGDCDLLIATLAQCNSMYSVKPENWFSFVCKKLVKTWQIINFFDILMIFIQYVCRITANYLFDI